MNVSHALPVQAMRGAVVYFSARVKAKDISDKPNSWNGVKVMAVMETPAGKLAAGRVAHWQLRLADRAFRRARAAGCDFTHANAWPRAGHRPRLV